MKPTIVSETDLFQILLKKLASEPHARIAGFIIYWLQFAKHRLKGRVGMFKEDKDLQADTGKQSSGRLLRELCRVPNSARPPKSTPRRLRLSEPLFDLAYGPKPRQNSGRVRWIFETEASRKILREAAEARQQKASTGRGRMSAPVSANCPHRSRQNAPTLISHTDSSNTQSAILSPEKSKKKMCELTGISSQEVNRMFKLWNRTCEKSGKPHLKWTGSDESRWSSQFIDIVEVLETDKLSDDGLEERLNILCNRLDEAGSDQSSSFKSHNKNGLTARSFAMYGRQLMAEAEKMLTTTDLWVQETKTSEVLK